MGHNLDEYANIGTHWIALYVNVIRRYVLTVLESKTFQKQSKTLLKYLQIFTNKFNKYLQNTSIQFNNKWIYFYWIYLFYP